MSWRRGKFLFGSKARPPRRIAQPYGTRSGDWPDSNETLVKEFDELTDDEAQSISKSVGVSGARRPPSE